MATTTATQVQPNSARFTYGHLIVLVGAVLGIAAFIWLLTTKMKGKRPNGSIYG